MNRVLRATQCALVVVLLSLAASVASATPVPRNDEAPAAAAPAPPAARAPTMRHGKVTHIEAIRERPPGTGKGAVIGGVLGAVVGNQFGHGTGRAALTVAGAAGGAVAGNNVERNINKRVIGYRVSVRMDNGRNRTIEQPRLDGVRVGDRVVVEGRRVRRD